MERGLEIRVYRLTNEVDFQGDRRIGVIHDSYRVSG